MKIWDTRTLSIPIKTCSNIHDGKGLCLEWIIGNTNTNSDTNNSDMSEASIYSGGSDCCVKSINVSDITPNTTTTNIV